MDEYGELFDALLSPDDAAEIGVKPDVPVFVDEDYPAWLKSLWSLCERCLAEVQDREAP